MIIQRVNRSDAEKIFIIAKNGSGATLTAGYPAYWDIEMTTPDGVQVTNSANSTTIESFAGIVDADIANGAYGKVQVYGFRSAARVYASSNSTAVGGRLDISAAGVCCAAATATKATTKPVVGFLCAAVGGSSSSLYYTTANIFIKAM